MKKQPGGTSRGAQPTPSLPRFVAPLLKGTIPREEASDVLGDLEELFRERVADSGPGRARLWVTGQVLQFWSRVRFERWRTYRPWKAGSPAPSGFRSPRPNSGGFFPLSSLLQDIRFWFRALLRKPLFSALVIGTLGMGIGATTFVFSLVDGVLLRDLPFEGSGEGELLNIWKTRPDWRGQEAFAERWDKIGLTWDEYLTLKESTQIFESVGIHRSRTLTLRGDAPPQRLDVGEANPALLRILGVRFALGRGFLPGEEGPGSPLLAVLSHSLWTSSFGADPDIVGKTIDLSEQSFEVIGVMAEDLRLPSILRNLNNLGIDGGNRALWVPIDFDMDPGLGGRQTHEAIGRLIHGATVDQARSELNSILREVLRGEEEIGFRLTSPKEEIVGTYRSSLRLLLAASGILLLIACLNTAALLVSETVGRKEEVATRVALGAGLSRIIRQLLTESVALSLCGAALGIVLASMGIKSFISLAPPLPRLEEVGVNHAIVLYSILVGGGTGVLMGLFPALSIQGYQRGRRKERILGWGRFQKSLLGLELGMTLVLLVSGGLLVQSLRNLSAVDPGFDPAAVATVRVHLSASESRDPHRVFTQIVDRVRQIPGVEEAGGVNSLPFPGGSSGQWIVLDRGREEEEISLITRNHTVIPGFFEAMGIALTMGRTFQESDAREESLPVMVISEYLARQYWPEGSPLGSRIRLRGVDYEVVGVVADVRERHLAEAPEPMVYVAGTIYFPTLSIVAKSEGHVGELVGSMRQAIRSINPEVSLSQETTLPTLVKNSTAEERYRTLVVTLFGSLALILASIGVFGVTAQMVSKRRREMGIRIALGAESKSLVLRMVSETALPGTVGLGVGLVAALIVGRLMTAFLFGIEAWDVATYMGVVLGLGGLSVVATMIPAARAGSVDPVQILREE